ncbi:MAG: hypothetical protein H7256_09305 [Bdellovibrio sp.]|nr:hypothetical protein [Bdellovibrio sp.]
MTSFYLQASPIPCSFEIWDHAEKSPRKYDIAKAYKSATVVIVGQADEYILEKPQRVQIIKLIKGKVGGEIDLEGFHSAGTDPFGTAITPKKKFLMLLSKDSKYKWVDSGSGCPNSFEVHGDTVTIGKEGILVSRLNQYFESNPKPFVIEY